MAKLRLLPDDPDIGWTPYLWLVYLPFQIAGAYAGHASASDWAIVLGPMALFLILYFRSYWVCGRELWFYAAGIVALGAIFTPFNPLASMYFIYGSGKVTRLAGPRRAWPVLGIYTIAVLAYGLLLHGPWYSYVYAVVFSGIVGAIVIREDERERANADLRLARDEIRRLAAVAERERIARDLHDVLGHTLSVIVLKSELASRLTEIDPARSALEIADVERIARESLSELRESIAGYRAVGLAAEVERAKSVLETAGVHVECELGEMRLPPRYEGVVTMAIREGVTNIVRHAGASSCRLSLAQTPRECRLELADDGRGGAASEGFGLAGMRERVEGLGGTLVREIAHGTRLILTLPLRDGS
jgi:two-component system sensor histidine kinase DesK